MDGTQHGISLAVSTVIFALRPHPETGLSALWIPLVRRISAPFEGYWALPGGWVTTDEGLADAAARNLLETTALEPTYLEQLYAFGETDRSPDGRVVSVVYWALVRAEEAERAAGGRQRSVVPRRRAARARVRPQRHRRLRPLAPAHQGRVQPNRSRLPRRDLHSHRAARGARSRAAEAPRPRQLPSPSGSARSCRPRRLRRAVATGRRGSTDTTNRSNSSTTAHSRRRSPHVVH